MRQFVIITSLLGSLIVLGITSGFFTASLTFLIVGGVPTTTNTLSPVTMLCLWAAIAAVALGWRLRDSWLADILRYEAEQQRRAYKRAYTLHRRRIHRFKRRHAKLSQLRSSVVHR